MNILINSYCNLHCPYCFADDTMKDNKEHKCLDMSEEDFRFVLFKLRQFNDHQARLIGGEPTLSPNFMKYLTICVEDPWINDVLIFSNFTFSSEIAEQICELSKKKHIGILPNINEFDLLIPKHKKQILYNIDYCSKYLPNFSSLGINIYRPDMDLTQWKLLLLEYPCFNNLRYSIAVPSKETLENNFDFYTYFHSFERILWELNEFSVEHKISVTCDCNNLPLCCYTSDLVLELLKGTGTDMFRNVGPCGFPVIDVNPDLTVVSCFGGADLCQKHKLEEFNSYEELTKVLHEEFNSTSSKYIARGECLTCTAYKRNGCSCSCKSTHLINKEEIIDE